MDFSLSGRRARLPGKGVRVWSVLVAVGRVQPPSHHYGRAI